LTVVVCPILCAGAYRVDPVPVVAVTGLGINSGKDEPHGEERSRPRAASGLIILAVHSPACCRQGGPIGCSSILRQRSVPAPGLVIGRHQGRSWHPLPGPGRLVGGRRQEVACCSPATADTRIHDDEPGVDRPVGACAWGRWLWALRHPNRVRLGTCRETLACPLDWLRKWGPHEAATLVADEGKQHASPSWPLAPA
jgi:hypothetical protein